MSPTPTLLCDLGKFSCVHALVIGELIERLLRYLKKALFSNAERLLFVYFTENSLLDSNPRILLLDTKIRLLLSHE